MIPTFRASHNPPKTITLGTLFGLATGVLLMAACPGQLEEQAWLADAGRGYGAGVGAPAGGAGGTAAPSQVPIGGTGGTGQVAPPPAQTPVKLDAAAPTPVPADASAPAPAPDAAVATPAPPTSNVPACATAAEISAKILMPKCGKCHGGATPAAGLDLNSAGAKLRLVDIPSKNCAGKTLVVKDPEVGGQLFDKLNGPVTGCGKQMPLNGTPLTDTEIECLKAWISPPGATPAPPPDPTPAVTPCSALSEITSKILTPKCGACHGAKIAAGQLDLVSAGVKARLLNVASKACSTRELISDDGDVAGLLFDKLVGPVPGCGMQMPLAAAPLSAVEVQCLKDWIKPAQ